MTMKLGTAEGRIVLNWNGPSGEEIARMNERLARCLADPECAERLNERLAVAMQELAVKFAGEIEEGAKRRYRTAIYGRFRPDDGSTEARHVAGSTD